MTAMQPTEPLNPNFQEDISASFAKLVLMRTIGAKLVRVEPGEVDVALPFRDELTQQLGYIAAGVVVQSEFACSSIGVNDLLPEATSFGRVALLPSVVAMLLRSTQPTKSLLQQCLRQ